MTLIPVTIIAIVLVAFGESTPTLWPAPIAACCLASALPMIVWTITRRAPLLAPLAAESADRILRRGRLATLVLLAGSVACGWVELTLSWTPEATPWLGRMLALAPWLLGVAIANHHGCRALSVLLSDRVPARTPWRGALLFLLPYLALSALMDLGNRDLFEVTAARRTALLALLFLVVLLLSGPLWRRLYPSHPLADEELSEKIEELCVRAGVHRPRVLVWRCAPVPRLDARIVGFPPFRYLCLADTWLEGTPRRHVINVCAHEVAHLKLRHLSKLGLLVAVALVGYLSVPWLVPEPTAVTWSIVAVVALLWFRYCFGPVSRSFELAADAAASELGTDRPSYVETLGYVAGVTGALEEEGFRHPSLATRIVEVERRRAVE